MGGFESMVGSVATLVLALLVTGCALDLQGTITRDAETAEQADADGSGDSSFDVLDDGMPDQDAADDGGVGECVPAGAERCNGLDDDCDGLIDEDLGETACGAGECTRTVQNCLDGVEQTCVPGDPDPGSCDAAEPGCGMSTVGQDNCLNTCTKEGPRCTCTGGTESDITVSGDSYRLHVFSDVGNFTLECGGAVSLEYLVIAGGGGGGSGRAGGGGGAGGYLAGSIDVSGSVPVTVGGGGAVGTSGGSSVLSSVTTVGGGGGGYGEDETAGQPGGSGGGGGFKNIEGGAGTPGQGHDGGAARSGNWIAGGGGGGAGGVGTPGTGDNEGVGGDGGPGLDSDITGTIVTRGGGGAGNGEHHDGIAGIGGGGAVGVSGTAGTGGGGGGDATGGSGVVIVRYRTD